MDEKVAKTPRPHMLDADEVAELLRIKKGSAYEVIRRINAEQFLTGSIIPGFSVLSLTQVSSVSYSE